MLSAVRKLVGADRSTKTDPTVAPTLDRGALETPIQAIRAKLEAANAEHDGTRARLREIEQQMNAAQQVFDAEPSEANADRLVALRQELDRRRLFVERTQRAAVAADGELKQAQEAKRQAILKHLDARTSTAIDRTLAICAQRVVPAVKQLVAALREVEDLTRDAHEAPVEAHRLRGASDRAWIAIRGLDTIRTAVKSSIRDAVPAPDRLMLERSVG